MFARLCVLILIACGSILSGCATKQTAQADPNSIIREPDNSHEIHGEAGVMYGASGR